MDVDLALTADAATIDSSGKLNILGVFDRISVQQFPAQHARVALVLRLVGGANDAGTHQMTIRLVSPGGEELIKLDGDLSITSPRGNIGGPLRIPHVLNLDGIVFPSPGSYSFDVIVDGQHKVSLPLVVEAPPRMD